MIDFHCHLDLYPNPHEVARTCIEKGIHLLSVTTTPSAWSGTHALSKDAPRIRTALGLHPQLAQQRRGELDIFERYLSDTRYVGEIGLDGAPECRSFWEDQLFVFQRILILCEAAGGRVLSIHSRRAIVEVLDALEAHPLAGTPILHWFSGRKRDLDRAVELGCWFSVGPGMLRGDKGRSLVAHIPRHRLLTETDGPFWQIDGRSSFPWEVQEATTILSGLWANSSDDVARQLRTNLAAIGRLAGVLADESSRHVDPGLTA